MQDYFCIKIGCLPYFRYECVFKGYLQQGYLWWCTSRTFKGAWCIHFMTFDLPPSSFSPLQMPGILDLLFYKSPTSLRINSFLCWRCDGSQYPLTLIVVYILLFSWDWSILILDNFPCPSLKWFTFIAFEDKVITIRSLDREACSSSMWTQFYCFNSCSTC